MHTALRIIQVVISIFLIVVILIQNRSSGLSATFGGSGGPITTSKRGAEKIVFKATIVLAILFVLSSLLFLFVR